MANVFDELDRYNNSPELQTARDKRQAIRREFFGDRLKRALGLDKRADSWELSDLELDVMPLGDTHPGISAVMYVREALADFDVPSQVHLTYTGMKRKSGSGAHRMKDGVVWVQAAFRSLSGVQHFVDVPVMVHAGHMVSPEVLVHNGQPRVMAQSTFDDIVGRGEVYRSEKDRKHMYCSPPNEADAARNRQREPYPTTSTGMFSVTAALRGYHRQADISEEQERKYEQEWQGERSPESVLEEVEFLLRTHGRGSRDLLKIRDALRAQLGLGRQANKGLDEAERHDDDRHAPGAEVSLANEVVLKSRGGGTRTVPAGTKGCVLRDMFGTGDVYYVEFADGCKAPVNKGDLK